MKPSARLTYRRFRPEDRPALVPLTRDPGALKYMIHNLGTEAEVDQYLALACGPWGPVVPGVERHWAVEETGRPGLVGALSLMMDEGNPSSGEVGYWFLPSVQGKGYAAEAAKSLVDYAFRLWGLHRVWGMCHVDNLASARVMEKAGMVREGTLREHRWLRNHYRSSHIYGLLSREHFGPVAGEVVFSEEDRVGPDFQALVDLLDQELSAKNGDDQDVFTAFNALAGIEDVVLARVDGRPIACASFKVREPGVGEVKRVYLDPAWRGQGLARRLMETLEARARRRGLTTLLVETSRTFAEANRLYPALGYRVVPNFPPYEGIGLSCCYRKELTP